MAKTRNSFIRRKRLYLSRLEEFRNGITITTRKYYHSGAKEVRKNLRNCKEVTSKSFQIKQNDHRARKTSCVKLPVRPFVTTIQRRKLIFRFAF